MSLLDGLLDLVFPKRCVSCRAAGGWLCESCSGGLTPLPAACCRRCGAPGDWSRRPCPECSGRSLGFASAAAAFTYQGAARDLVTACKFRALRSLTAEMVSRAAPAFRAACAAPVAAEGAACLTVSGVVPRRGSAVLPASGSCGDLVVTWVPGHRDHNIERGFNQAELLGRGLAREVGLPAAPLLRRVRHGARQSGLGRAARAANVADAFGLHADVKRVGTTFKRVMIIDDVYTTGETLNHCSGVLAQAGLEPHAFTFARTVRAASLRPARGVPFQKESHR